MAKPAHLKDGQRSDEVGFAAPAPEERGSGILSTLLLAIVLTIFVRTFVAEPYQIPTGSMEQTIQVGDRVIGEKVSYRFRDPQPGEVVTFVREQDGHTDTLIKRVIAVAGQTVDLRDGVVYVDGVALDEPYVGSQPTLPLQSDDPSIAYPYTVPEGYLWVMGDNRTNSRDSRAIGPVRVDDVTSHAVVIFWPPEDIATI